MARQIHFAPRVTTSMTQYLKRVVTTDRDIYVSSDYRRKVIVKLLAMTIAVSVTILLLVPNAEAKLCPGIVSPVCALDGARVLQTFNNACEAVKGGATVLHQGKCYAEFCSHLCITHGVYGKGVIAGTVRLYDNMCWAEKDFAVFVKYGPCPRN